MKKSELIHWRLQAMLREHTFRDLQYLGVRPDSVGIDQHWYRIGEAEVPVDSITELDTEEEDNESCLLYTSPSPRDRQKSRMPSSA